jgi:DMSO reductase family type II enzyme chaperone
MDVDVDDTPHSFIEDRVSRVLLRGTVYQALALGFAYPSPSVRERLNAQWRTLLNSTPPWPEGVRGGFQRAAGLLETTDGELLEREYTRLFGPAGGCSLRETSYGDAARLLGRAAHLADISGFYLAFGLQPASGAGAPEDHIGVELEFMSLLNLKEAYALAEGWDEQAQVTRDAQRSFLQDHLGTWISALTARLRSADPHPFYAALGEILQRLVTEDARRLGVSPVALPGPAADPDMGGDTFECPLAGRQPPLGPTATDP